MINILMIGKPGGNLVRTYEWHIEALKNDRKNRFNVDCIHQISDKKINIEKYDFFWFYAKAFQPQLYHQIKHLKPDSKIICGPNVLLDKPDIGISDDWDAWYVNQCKPDLHLDQVEFYSNHVKKFLSEETKTVAKVLDKCLKIDDALYNPKEEKVYDCLLYSKKRRYDYDFENFRFDLIEMLEEANITFCEVAAGKFGSYKREEYFNLLNKSKVMINLSLDECPGILNYESMFFNVPVIGSKSNVPVNSSHKLYVEDTDYMTEKYLVRKNDASAKYFKKIKEFLNGVTIESPRDFIIKYTNFDRYCDNVEKLINEIK